MITKDFKIDTNLIKKRITDIIPFGYMTQDLAATIAQRHNAKVTDLNFKTYESIVRKCKAVKCQVTELKDLARTTIVCQYNAISSVVKDLINTLKGSGCFGRYVQQEYESRGYWGVIVNPVFFVDGKMVMTEIQITSNEMFYASHASDLCSTCLGSNLYNSISKTIGVEGGKGHLYYEISRDKSGAYTTEQKLQAEKDNYNYYHNFWGDYKFGKTDFLN